MFKAVVMNQAEDGRSVLSVEELDDGFSHLKVRSRLRYGMRASIIKMGCV